MPAPGAQSNSVGPLFAMTNFNCLKLSKNGTVAQIGTGNRWKAVYEWIEPYGLAINGGRYAQVGVGGLLLGGGINNFGNSHGWSVNSVVNFEVVLASGKLASVNAKSYPDLFWALKGGSSNFAIVTRFDMKTIPIHGAITGISQWFGPSVPLVLDALASFIAPGGGIDDPKTQINPSVAVIPKNGSVSSLNIAFVKDNTTIPTALENFTAVTPFATSLGPRPSWASGALELAGYNVQHER